MQRIILFFIRNRNFLLFALLFFISVSLTINSHSYHQSKFVSSTNFFSGVIFSIRSSISEYFSLKKQNEILADENNTLRSIIANNPIATSEFSENPIKFLTDSTLLDSNYKFIAAKVISNNYSKTKNNLTLNQGINDSLKVDMGVISSKGIVGKINGLSNNYSSVQSVLNTNSQVVAKFKKTNHFGTLVWNTLAPNVVQLTEIPRLAPVAIGDTIVTDGKSTIFPEGIPIGRVKDYERDESKDYYDINIELFTDMTSVKHVYVVYNKHRKEIKELEQQIENAEQ